MTTAASALYNRLLARARLRHLHLMVLTAELGNTHKVADVAGLSQPSVVKFLANLEQLLDVQLFERHARGMRPTAACLELLPDVRAVLNVMQSGAQSLSDLKAGSSGIVHVGALPAACHGPIMSSIARFADSHPDFQLHLRENTAPILLEDLASGATDVLLIRQPTSVAQGYRFDPLQSDHSVVLARVAHPLATRRGLDIATLGRAKWLTFPDSMTSRIIFEQWYADAPDPPRTVNVTTTSLSAIVAMVAESDALIVLPASVAAPALAAGRVRALDVKRQDTIRPLGVMWPEANVPVAVNVFCKWLIAAAQINRG